MAPRSCWGTPKPQLTARSRPPVHECLELFPTDTGKAYGLEFWFCPRSLILYSGREAVLQEQPGGTKELVLQCKGLREDESLQVSPSYKAH